MMNVRLRTLGIAICSLLLSTSPMPGQPPPRSPEESWRAIQVRPDMQVELVASEPLVEDPIAIAWGPDGRLWVVEMGDYPLGVDGQGAAGGRIKVLEDVDGDGRYDKATMFLEGLSFPTGLLPWRDGLLVTCAPDIFFAEDTDGDGRADRREVLFTGFPERNQQHRVNGLQWGLDNQVHGANGDGGVGGETRIKCLKTGHIVELRGRDFRFRPDTGELDPQTGKTQFGRNRDDWGNWFGSNNAQPLYHFVLADEYLRRNPHVRPPDPRVHLMTTRGPYFSLAPNVPMHGERVRQGDGPFRVGLVGPCSGVVYRDDLLGPEFTGNALVCDPVTNLVHRVVLTRDGVTFRGRRAADETDSEFFASRDSWTRPVMARTGPDGALWVVDMYRLVIEHPQWISAATKRQLDLRSGRHRGRIYRVYPRGKRPRRMLRLDKLETAALASVLDSPNGWQRDTAGQMLLWRADPATVKPLVALLRSSKNPMARLHALCTLDGLGKLTSDVVGLALVDEHPEIRRHAIRLAEPWLDGDADPSTLVLQDRLLALARDASPMVRLQLVYSLGQWSDSRAGHTLADLALAASDDPYLIAAILSSLKPDSLGRVLSVVVNRSHDAEPPVRLLSQLAEMAGATQSPEAVRLVRQMAQPKDDRFAAWQYRMIGGWFDATKRHGAQTISEPLDRLLDAARRTATDDQADDGRRIAAIRVVGRRPAKQQEEVQVLALLLIPRTALAVQLASVDRLAEIDSDRVPKLLLAGWRSHGPALRSRILDVLLSRQRWAETLIESLAEGTVATGDVDARRRHRLLYQNGVRRRDAEVRERALGLSARGVSSDRQKVVDAWRSKLGPNGDAKRGRAVFEKRCAACHRFADLGQAVGPDLAALAGKPAEDWLIALLDPNRAVEPRYVSYVAATAQGRVLTGIISAETAISITLVDTDGRSQTILRTEIDQLQSSNKSLMPEGLENDLSPGDLTDLFAYVRGDADAAATPTDGK